MEEVFALGKKEIERASVQLDAVGHVLDGEGHCGRLRGDIEFLEKAGEVRVGDLVIDHETRVEREHPAVFLDLDGVRVAAYAVVLLEEGEIGLPFQEMGACEAGDACADDGCFWAGQVVRRG